MNSIFLYLRYLGHNPHQYWQKAWQHYLRIDFWLVVFICLGKETSDIAKSDFNLSGGRFPIFLRIVYEIYVNWYDLQIQIQMGRKQPKELLKNPTVITRSIAVSRGPHHRAIWCALCLRKHEFQCGQLTHTQG